MSKKYSGPGHVGHGGQEYQGTTNGCDTWRCNGCGETLFVPIEPKTPARWWR